jgi:hypothetical protein
MVFRRSPAVLVVLVALTSCDGGAKKADPQQFAKDWSRYEAVNFTVYTPLDTPRPRRGIEVFGKACDETYDYVARQLKLQVEDDIAIYLFTSTEDCEAATGRPAGFVEGLKIYTRLGAPVGGVIAEAMCNSIDREAKSFKLIRDGVRNFFDERDQNVHYEALALRQTREWPTLEDLLYRQSASDPEVYKYASASYVAFLIQRYGTDQFHMLWRSVLDLRPSVEKIYGGTLPQMEEEWFRIQDKLAKRT